MKPSRMHLAPLALLLVLAIARPLIAADLAEVFADAKANDPVVGAAEANYLAQRESVPQTRAGLLPTVSAGSNVTRSSGESQTVDFNTFSIVTQQQESASDGYSVSLNQTLVDASRWYDYFSARAGATRAEWEFANAEQNLITRVAQTYLSVLRVHALLVSTRAAEDAARRQLEQVQQRFDVGLVAITDVLDSQAALDAAIVNRIQAEGDHDIFFEGLRTLTGVSYDSVLDLADELPIVDPAPVDEEEWVQTALATNFLIRSAQAGLKSAERNLRARLAGHLPTVDANVSYNASTSDRTFFGTPQDLDTNSTSYRLNLSLPLFTGGATHSRFRQARHQVAAARQQLIQQELTVTRDTRSFFRAVQTDVARVEARLKAIRSAQSALEATETGYEVGTRNIVEVLQAQNRLFSSQFDYADSRYNYVLNLLRLKQAAGVLQEADLDDVNGYADAEKEIVRLN